MICDRCGRDRLHTLTLECLLYPVAERPKPTWKTVCLCEDCEKAFDDFIERPRREMPLIRSDAEKLSTSDIKILMVLSEMPKTFSTIQREVGDMDYGEIDKGLDRLYAFGMIHRDLIIYYTISAHGVKVRDLLSSQGGDEGGSP